MKELIKSKKSRAAIITLVITIVLAIIQNGGLEGIIIDIPGSDPIEIKLPEDCNCNECSCEEVKCGCSGDGCYCPECLKLT